MADQIPAFYVQKFDTDFKLVAQQTQSRLEARVTRHTGIVGKSKSCDFFDKVEMDQVLTRLGDINLREPDAIRTWIDLADWDLAQPVDSFDALKILSDPKNKYIANALSAANRRKDRAIITALGGSSRRTDAAGTSSLVALPAASKVAHGSAGMTLAKLRTAIELLNKAEVDSPEEGGERTFVHSSKALTDLMADSNVTSADYNTLKALQNYEVDQFMGMKWVRSDLLTLAGGYRYCYVFGKSAIECGLGQDVKTSIDKRTDKRSLPIQIYTMLSIGAARSQDAGVVEIAMTES